MLLEAQFVVSIIFEVAMSFLKQNLVNWWDEKVLG